MREPWERLTGEGSKAYATFVLYRDMGQDRSLRKLAQGGECRAKKGQLERWSSKWGWVERCQKYDDHLEYQERLQQEKERREMHKRHAKMAVLGQGTVLEALRRIKPEDLTPSQAVQWFDALAKIERLSRGEATDIHKSEHSGPDGGPIEVTDALSKLLDKLAR